MRTQIDMAKAFVKKWHGDQLYGDHSIMKHLDDVSNVLTEFGINNIEYHVVAYLHDVLEDTAAKVWDVEHEFGPDTAFYVYLVTDPPLATRRERKEELHARFRDMDPNFNQLAIVVKLADRIANVRATLSVLAQDNIGYSHLEASQRYSMYYKEYLEFKRAFYRTSTGSPMLPMWAELDRLHDAED